jgi:hypothetical protein
VLNRHLALLGAVSLLACGGAESHPGDSAAALAASPNVVTITATDFAFEAPDTIPAGVTTIRLVNRGPALHHAQLLRLNEGRTLDDLLNALKQPGPLPTWAVEMGGPNPPAPGEATNTTQDLQPGSYAVVCFVDIPDRVPHIMKGMVHAFTVVPSTSTAAEPPADVTMELADYTFTLSAPLAAGTRTIRVDNTGPQAHEVALVRLDSGKTVADLMKWAQTFEGPPPGRPLGGVAGLGVGQRAYFTVDLAPAEYVMLCFVPDARDGKAHAAHGMVQTFRVNGDNEASSKR